jgi:hypothetical protein
MKRPRTKFGLEIKGFLFFRYFHHLNSFVSWSQPCLTRSVIQQSGNPQSSEYHKFYGEPKGGSFPLQKNAHHPDTYLDPGLNLGLKLKVSFSSVISTT